MASQAEKDLQALREQEAIRNRMAGKKIASTIPADDLQTLKEIYGSAEAGMNAVKKATEDVNREIKDLKTGLSDFRDLTESIRSEFSRIDTATTKVGRSYRKISGFASELTDLTLDMSKASVKDVKALKEKTLLEFKRLKLLKQKTQEEVDSLELKYKEEGISVAEKKRRKAQLDSAKAANSAAEDEVELKKKAEEVYDNILNSVKEIESIAGIGAGLLGGLGSALDNIGLGSIAKHFNKGAEAAKEFAAEAKEDIDEIYGDTKGVDRFVAKQIASIAALGKGVFATIKSTFSDIFSAQGIIIGGLTLLFKQFTHIDHVASNIGKTMGLTRQASLDMAADLKSAATASGDVFLNMDRMVDAQLRLSSSMGTTVRLTEEQLANNARLVELAGFSEEQAQGMFRSSLLTGKSQEDLYDTVVATNDTIFSSNSLLKEASQITGQLAMLNGNNVAQLSRSVAAAKRMGINMETARDMAMGTLDFESSIRAEMELAAITGKRINLNKARELAFQGKFNAAAAEILKQEAVREAFQNGNVIAQRKAAEAAGLSVDQLAEAFNKQREAGILRRRQIDEMKKMAKERGIDNINELTHEQRMSLRREANLRDLRLNQTFGEKINMVTAKLGDLLGKVVGPAVDYFGDGLDRAVVFFGSLFGHSVDTKGATDEMTTKLEEAKTFGESLSSKFQSAKDFVIEMKDKLTNLFGEETTGTLGTLGKIVAGGAGGFALFKGAQNLFKGKGLFGQKLGASPNNPLFVTMAKDGAIGNIMDMFGNKKGKRGKGNMLQRMMGSFKMPKMTGLGNIAKGAGKLLGGAGRIAGKAFLPLAAAMSVFDGVKGFTADPDAALGDKLKNAGSSILNGLTFGLLGKSPDEISSEAQSQGVAAAQEIPAAQVQAATGQVAPATSLPPMPATDDTNELLRHLIQVVSAGGDVIMDGRKVGSTLQMASFKL
tara:strand:+ start:82 stop:2916 length:2835 start_codon:yes stop_codon:yes gene_type:complete